MATSESNIQIEVEKSLNLPHMEGGFNFHRFIKIDLLPYTHIFNISTMVLRARFLLSRRLGEFQVGNRNIEWDSPIERLSYKK